MENVVSFFCITTSQGPVCKLACEGDFGDCRTPKGFALRCETELKSSRSQPTRFEKMAIFSLLDEQNSSYDQKINNCILCTIC